MPGSDDIFYLRMLEVVIFVCSMAQLPESSFEKMSAEARAKERLDRQKMLVKGRAGVPRLGGGQGGGPARGCRGPRVGRQRGERGGPEGEAGAGDQGGPGDDGALAQDVAGSGHGGARLRPEGVQSGAHLRGVGGGGSQAVGEVSQGERSQQEEGSGRFVLCV
jgi:hypothetical protein